MTTTSSAVSSYASESVTHVYIGRRRFNVHLDAETAKTFNPKDESQRKELAERVHAHAVTILSEHGKKNVKEITIHQDRTVVGGKDYQHQGIVLLTQQLKVKRVFGEAGKTQWAREFPERLRTQLGTEYQAYTQAHKTRQAARDKLLNDTAQAKNKKKEELLESDLDLTQVQAYNSISAPETHLKTTAEDTANEIFSIVAPSFVAKKNEAAPVEEDIAIDNIEEEDIEIDEPSSPRPPLMQLSSGQDLANGLDNQVDLFSSQFR